MEIQETEIILKTMMIYNNKIIWCDRIISNPFADNDFIFSHLEVYRQNKLTLRIYLSDTVTAPIAYKKLKRNIKRKSKRFLRYKISQKSFIPNKNSVKSRVILKRDATNLLHKKNIIIIKKEKFFISQKTRNKKRRLLLFKTHYYTSLVN